MRSIDSLAEQHILESESRLRHIDELLVKARQPFLSAPAASELRTLLSQVSANRARLGQELEEVRRAFVQGSDSRTAQRGQSLKSSLEEVGIELERALMAIIGSRKS